VSFSIFYILTSIKFRILLCSLKNIAIKPIVWNFWSNRQKWRPRIWMPRIQNWHGCVAQLSLTHLLWLEVLDEFQKNFWPMTNFGKCLKGPKMWDMSRRGLEIQILRICQNSKNCLVADESDKKHFCKKSKYWFVSIAYRHEMKGSLLGG
jgi:hypothetical protein